MAWCLIGWRNGRWRFTLWLLWRSTGFQFRGSALHAWLHIEFESLGRDVEAIDALADVGWRGGFVSCPAERAAVAEPDIIPVDVSGGMGVIVARAIVERIGLVTPPPSPNTMETMTFGCARERGESRRA